MQSLTLRLRNIVASGIVLLAGLWVYGSLPYFQRYFSRGNHLFGQHFSNWQVLKTAAAAYAVALLLYYLFERKPGTPKAHACLRGLLRLLTSFAKVFRQGLPAEEKLGMLNIALKFFFAPLMVVWLFEHMVQLSRNGFMILEFWDHPAMTVRAMFDGNVFWFLFQLILLFDVFFFTIGYLVEMPQLKNEIRSVDPTLFGWLVALACYPPFNQVTNSILGWNSIDFPFFLNPVVHYTVSIVVLLLMAVYAWASVALNLKASNLTHRGVIAHGPYRFVRHPAYVCKNLAWWLGLIPAATVAFNASVTAGLLVLGSMAGWTLIYAMRAFTEENHLRSVDGEYDEYCSRVKYRFIPGVL